MKFSRTYKSDRLSDEEAKEVYRLIAEGTPEERVQARNRLVSAYYYLVVAVCLKLRGIDHRNEEDALQTGMLALMRAAKLFDRFQGFKFSTYAYTSIFNAVSNYLRRQAIREVRCDCTAVPLDQIAVYNSAEADTADVLEIEPILGSLSPREKEIVCRRYGMQGREQSTLAVIGKDIGISRERVRQIQSAAQKKIRKSVLKSLDVHCRQV